MAGSTNGRLSGAGGFGLAMGLWLASVPCPADAANGTTQGRLQAVREVLWRGKEPQRIEAIRALSGNLHPEVKRILFGVLTVDPSAHVRSAALMVLAPRVGATDLPVLRRVRWLEEDPGLKRLVGSLVGRLAFQAGSSSGSGRPLSGAQVKKRSEAGSEGTSVFFSLNAGMQVSPGFFGLRFPLANTFVQLGVRIRRFEIALEIGDPMVPLPALALGFKAAYYSVFRRRFRLRHGLGVDVFVPVSDAWGAMVKFYLCDMSIRLSRLAWFEISAFGLNTGRLRRDYEPMVGFSLTIGLRIGL